MLIDVVDTLGTALNPPLARFKFHYRLVPDAGSSIATNSSIKVKPALADLSRRSIFHMLFILIVCFHRFINRLKTGCRNPNRHPVTVFTASPMSHSKMILSSNQTHG